MESLFSEKLKIIDIIIFTLGWSVGNIIFNNFEKHLPLYRRAMKFFILFVVFILIGIFFGRIGFYAALVPILIGILLLHFWYFPKNGINGITAQPYNKYLKLIKIMKSKVK